VNVHTGRFTAAAVTHAAVVARLDLEAERVDLVQSALNGICSLVDLLDDVELGEAMPAFAFDADWGWV
jgi:Asp-tRNA(Asn)/Glu-tRNA(Gln) amidotransferase C subunit